MSDLVGITETDFDSLVLSAERPVVLDFWAPWCGSCRLMMRAVSEISQERDDLSVYGVNIDEDSGIARRCSVKGVPTLILFRDGAEVVRVTRATPKSGLLAIFDEALGLGRAQS